MPVVWGQKGDSCEHETHDSSCPKRGFQSDNVFDRHCPTEAEVDHGTVAVVLILNRLMAPRPLYRVTDWLARTVLVYTLGVSAEKFNDDRLGRTLDAISERKRDIWQDVVHRAFVQAQIDLSNAS
jgi:hypothetical protein